MAAATENRRTPPWLRRPLVSWLSLASPQASPRPFWRSRTAHAERSQVPRVGFSNGAVSGDGPSSARTVVIAKGETLWGLSKKYGVSVDAIREANGITGNKIYAGKKLIIP